MEPLLPQCKDMRTRMAIRARTNRDTLQQLAEQVDLSQASTWQGEVRELCHAFVTGHRPDLRERRARMAMLAAGCEGPSRTSHGAIAKLMHVPEGLVKQETGKLFSRLAETAMLGVLPQPTAIQHKARGGMCIEALMCARFASEVLGMPIDEPKTKLITKCYQSGSAPEAGVSQAVGML